MIVRAVVQARMLSSRLRGKSLMAVAGQPLMVRVLHRIKAMSFIDQIVVATTSDAADDPIVAVARDLNIRCIRGDRSDLLGRFIQASINLVDDDSVVRFTADNPLYDPLRSAQAYQAHVSGKWDYTHIEGLSHMLPEFIQVGTLRRLVALTNDPFDREHVTPYLRKHAEDFHIQTLPPDFAGLRPELDDYLTIDNQENLEMFESMFEDIEKPNQFIRLDDCYLWLDRKKAGLHGILTPTTGELRVKIAGHEIGDGCPCFIVAEIGQNHNGQIGMAKRLIDMAARCGIDAVKFQKRDIRCELTEQEYNKLYDNPNSFGKTYGEHREFLELSEQQHKELREYSLANNLIYFCTVCDEPSVEIMERVVNPAYKVASRDITNIPLLKVIAKTGKPVIISTGMAGIQEICEAIEALGERPSGMILTQCVSQYPAEVEHTNLRAIRTLRDEFKCPVGLSDHTPGIITAVAAVVLGACLVEKHITLSRAMQGTDHAAGLEEEDLRQLVKYIRTCAKARGNGKKEYNPIVEETRKKLARSLTSRMFIPVGATLTEEMLTLKSPGTGIDWRKRHRIVGRKAKHNIPVDQTLSEDDFQ